MEPLTVPPSPNWYETKIAICAPDNTLIYGANSSIVIIKPAPSSKPSDISVISFAHLDRVHALAMAPTWNEQNRMIASIADDKLVKVWNLLDNTCAYSHKAHAQSKSRPVGVAFINDTKVVSVSEDGYVIVWKMTTNEFTPHKNLLGMKAHVTAISTCPHAGWLTAFGMRNGLVVVTDLKGHGNVLYKLRAHEREVLDFAWCPKAANVIPDLIFKKKSEASKETSGDDAQDTIDAMPANGTHIHCALDSQLQSYESQQIGAITSQDDDHVTIPTQVPSSSQPPPPKPKKANPWANLKHADDDEMPQEPEPAVQEVLNTTDDFLSECLALKARIIETKDEEVSFNDSLPLDESIESKTPVRKILQATRVKKIESKKVMDAAGDAPSADIVSDLLSDDATSSETTVNECDTPPAVESPKPEFLLASSARGGHIVIWRAGTDGRVQRRMRLPKAKSRGGYGRNNNNNNNMWLTMHWIAPEQLLSCGASGELMVWPVSDQDPKPKLIHNDHPKLFCITSPYCHERENYSKWEDLAAWTIGQDRSILYTMLQSRMVLACYPTFPCPVVTSAASPIAPTRVAFGMADGFIRVWDLSKENNQCIQMIQIKSKVGGKVMSMAWHTSQEYFLAFGTQDGLVGFVNCGQSKKPPVYFAQHFITAIYKLEWAPIPNKPVDKHGLYCCAEGQLAVYNFDNPLINPVLVQTPTSERVTNFAWKSDYSKLAIGCKSGTVYILDAQYEVKTTLYYQKKGIVSMAWHSIQTAEDEEKSPNHEWLASATGNDNTVVIFDLSKVNDELCMKEVIAGELFGHVKPINQVFWSPYKNGIIGTASEDGTVTVWSGMKPISTFLNNNADPVFSGLWSPLNEDVIISTGKDCSIRVWNLRNHPTKELNDLAAQTRSARKKNLKHFRSQKEEIELEVNKSRRYPLLAEISARQAKLETATADCHVMFEHYNRPKEEVAEDNLMLKLFGNPNCISEIIDAQKDVHRSKGKFALVNHLQMWSGDVGETIKKAITDGNLTPWLISVAPMISFSLWQEAVEAYASQLADSTISDPVEIASYYLALHKVDEAIDILSVKQMYRESLVLAKLKKPDDTDLHKQILSQWASACVMTGQFEIAAQSYIAQGQFEEAAKVLYRRNDEPSLAFALELARFTGNDTLANTIQYRHDVLQAQAEDKVQLPSRMELEVAKAERASEKAEEGSTEGVNGDGDDIDKNADSGNNENGNGDIHVADRTNGGEEKTAASDNREVDAADNEHVASAKSVVVGDAIDKQREEDCSEDITSSAN
ncbi:gem-associated protein 5 isoform X2 [Atheta coriaria]|uniref:gem-associated protein 5 isoform X2 n=1 Tax=Dalotia coriaria TaxID=877792 RepID=UPI0031F44247